MSIKQKLRYPIWESRYLRLIAVIIMLVATGIAFYTNYTNVKEITYEGIVLKTKSIDERLQEQNLFLNQQIKSIEGRMNNLQIIIYEIRSANTVSSAPNSLNIRLASTESKLEEVSNKTEALRQAINPLKPEEVLTIARLKDELIKMNQNFDTLEENLKSSQEKFEASIRSEQNSSNQSTTLILVVIIPLILNFLYTVWKDFKKPIKSEADAKT